jgi:hypothetical protein
MILDYHQSQPRRGPTLACCLRTLWSRRALGWSSRRSASWIHAVCGTRRRSPPWPRCSRPPPTWLRDAPWSGSSTRPPSAQWLVNDLVHSKARAPGESRSSWCRSILPSSPPAVYVAACFWSRRKRGAQSWTRCFAATCGRLRAPAVVFPAPSRRSASSPLVDYDDLWHHHLKPADQRNPLRTLCGIVAADRGVDVRGSPPARIRSLPPIIISA